MKYLIPLLLFLCIPMRGQSGVEKAENYFSNKQYQQAKPLFEKYLEQYPNDLKTIEYLGDTNAYLDNWPSAIFYYQKLKIRKPYTAEYYYKYGGAMAMLAKKSNGFKALSMIDDIKSAFLKTIALNPNHIAARWALIEVYLQLPAVFGGSEKVAKRYANELLRISTVDGYLAMGHIEEYYKNYASAEKEYKKAIEVGNSQTAYQKLADLYKNKMDQPEKAKRLLASFNEKNKT